jgi:hypothetical protein
VRASRVVALVAGAFIVAQVTPAFGAPSLASLVKRIDQREKRHYASLDRRIKASVLLTLNQSIKTNRVSAPMSQSPPNPRYFSGIVSCASGQLVGGGVDWNVSADYGDYRVIRSAPSVGALSWQAAVDTGASPTPSTAPQVYAICATV